MAHAALYTPGAAGAIDAPEGSTAGATDAPGITVGATGASGTTTGAKEYIYP